MKNLYSKFRVALNIMDFSLITRFVTSVLLLLCGYFIGGVVFVLVLLTCFLITESMSRFLGTALAISAGIVFSLFGILVEFLILVPSLRSFGPTRSLFFDEARIKPFEAREFVFENLIELNYYGAFLIAVLPAVVAFIIFLKTRKQENRVHFNPFIILIAFAPLLIAVYRKAQDPISYVISTASGDGRNFFLHVQRIRVTSGFTGISNFISQGDFGASMSSLVSDGLGSNGLLRFDDQYSIAAMYVLCGSLIASSVIAIIVGITTRNSKFIDSPNTTLFYAISIVASTICVQMPWVMNEMFRSGFFSAVAVMSLSAVFVAACFSEISYKFKSAILLCVSVLIFATYQIAAIYSLVALLLISMPIILRTFRTNPIRVSVCAGFFGVSSLFLLPKIIDQMRTRLLLDGAITYLNDSLWLPISIAGALMTLRRGILRTCGVVIFVAGGCTYGFQHLARVLRENQGQIGYGYYGAKLAYVGLFIIIVSVVASVAALVLSNMQVQGTDYKRGKNSQHIVSALSAVGVLLLANSIGKLTIPDSRNFYQGGHTWTQPSTGGLELALSYWDMPRVLFVKVSDPGNDRLINFWHPYFWSGDPWNWAYTGNSEDPSAVCAFIAQRNVLVLTVDSAYAQLLRQTCNASVKVI